MTGNDRHSQDTDSLSSRAPGEDPEDPYDDVAVNELPDWWREAIEEFDSHDLRPYRPPMLSDEKHKFDIVSRLEAVYNVDIMFLNIDVDTDFWEIRISGETVDQVGHYRDPDGYSVFEIDEKELECLVSEFVEE